MAIEPIDLKRIWESGQTWQAWLAASQDPKRREEMERICKDVQLPAKTAEALRGLKRAVHVMAIAEDWCGDVRRNVPVVARLCAENPDLLRLRCVEKATQPQLMVRYLTNGAEAIPIVVFFTDNFVEVGHWGPRPAECKRFIARGKAARKMEAAYVKVGAFYERDQHQSTVAELLAMFELATATEV